MTITTASTASPSDLISSDLFTRLANRVMEDIRVSRTHATRVVNQALLFLVACAASPGSNLSPTKVVDPGWHAFILHTEDYAEFCNRIAGGFIHHRPVCNDDIRSGAALARTVQAIREIGYPVDSELWRVDIADCNQCHATCHDSP